MNICKNCMHYLTTGDGQIWYDQWCTAPAVRKPEAICPQTGKKGWISCNDLGGRFVDDREHPFARDINPDGNCRHYRRQGNLKVVGS